MLILSEGARTEPNYFDALKRDLDLASVHVGRREVLMTDVPKATRDAWSRGFDEVWYVVDEDERRGEIGRLLEGLSRLRQPRGRSVRAVVSTPCFEYWILLHFEYTDRQFHGMEGGQSACGQVIQRLRGHLPGYKKNDASVYRQCRPKLDDAIRNVRRLGRTRTPSTEVGSLVERLQRLADSLKAS